MLPLLWSTLTLTMHESATWRLYAGRAVMDTERLWCEVEAAGFGRAPPQGVAAEQRSSRQSEDELEGVGESEEEEAEENDSDTLEQELWKD